MDLSTGVNPTDDPGSDSFMLSISIDDEDGLHSSAISSSGMSSKIILNIKMYNK